MAEDGDGIEEKNLEGARSKRLVVTEVDPVHDLRTCDRQEDRVRLG